MPAAQPARVGAFAISESSIQIAWDEVPAIHRNGIITLYEVQYWQSGDESDTTTVPVDPDEFVLDVDGLGDFLTYLIRVRASTAVGAGPYSSPAVEVAPEQDGMYVHSDHINHTFWEATYIFIWALVKLLIPEKRTYTVILLFMNV